MPATQTEPRVTFQIAEEGETIGTVKQFASRMNLPQPRVLSCLNESDTASVVLPAGGEEARLLIVDADGLEALLHCATDQDCTQSREATGEYLGIGLTGVVNAFNPARVVLGGGVIEGHPGYVDHAPTIVDERALQVATEDLDVVRSELGGRAGVVGAATMARRRTDAPASLAEQD